MAAFWDCPTTPGTVTQLPLDTTRLTAVFGGALVPAAGFCADTTPLGWPEQAVVWLPTFRLSPRSVAPAAAGDCPTTLGTDTEVWVFDTVRVTLCVSRILVPPAGSWLGTVPTGWLLLTLWTV